MALQGTENAYEKQFLPTINMKNSPNPLFAAFVSCGHISCFWCVHRSMSPLCESHCPKCGHQYHHFPTICWMLHFLLRKMYPLAYKRREIQTLEEEKKGDCYSPQFDDDNLVSKVKFDHPSTSSSCNPVNAGLSGSMEQSGSETQKQQKISVEDVMCSACKQLLFHPVVFNCGHVYCESCIKNSAEEILRCQICQLSHPGGFPKVCLELDDFIKEQFPEEYAKQRDAVQLRHISDNPETPSCSLNKDGGEKAAWWSDPHSKLVHVGVGCDFCGVVLPTSQLRSHWAGQYLLETSGPSYKRLRMLLLSKKSL